MAKCAECGFLASRNKQTRILQETEPEARNKGFINELHQAPICLMNMYDLWEEMNTPYGNDYMGGYEKIVSALQTERDCKQFTEWHKGFTPKEHREMINSEQQQKHLEERENQQRISDKRWHLWEIVAIAVATISAGVVGAFAQYLVSHH